MKYLYELQFRALRVDVNIDDNESFHAERNVRLFSRVAVTQIDSLLRFADTQLLRLIRLSSIFYNNMKI